MTDPTSTPVGFCPEFFSLCSSLSSFSPYLCPFVVLFFMSIFQELLNIFLLLVVISIRALQNSLGDYFFKSFKYHICKRSYCKLLQFFPFCPLIEASLKTIRDCLGQTAQNYSPASHPWANSCGRRGFYHGTITFRGLRHAEQTGVQKACIRSVDPLGAELPESKSESSIGLLVIC